LRRLSPLRLHPFATGLDSLGFGDSFAELGRLPPRLSFDRSTDLGQDQRDDSP
jgi:hypothetical protein